ncbi:uncharacterized protein HGUI_01607 [Hanseniaspora guilliermondii]|uniref:sphinganine-1-phosphate aldolase n=1 Tax=Hanseniaspora guilliermondii TaxID=56406 RepID=A0A1L0CX59_9ASCO|nr:uncharacterized protein HGUI_01607 [Hanseniaspora guilliermondii]
MDENYIQKQGLSDIKTILINTLSFFTSSTEIFILTITISYKLYYGNSYFKFSNKDLLIVNLLFTFLLYPFYKKMVHLNFKIALSGFILKYIVSFKNKESLELSTELQKMKTNILNDIHKDGQLAKLHELFPFEELNEEAISGDELLKKLYTVLDIKMKNNDLLFEEQPYSQKKALQGFLSGGIYHNDTGLIDLQSKIYKIFILGNQLHPDCFPILRYLDTFVVKQTINFYTDRDDEVTRKKVCGMTTSGGTESILLACLSARNRWYYLNPVQRALGRKPKMILPETCHAAFFKACNYFDIDCITVKSSESFFSVVSNYKNEISLIVSSFPNFPYGTTENLSKFNELVGIYDIPWHIDCCLGSFINPFVSLSDSIGVLPNFSKLKCTSISVDTHKYGYSAKGVSVLLFKDSYSRQFAYFKQTNWVGGLYGSPTLAGSRPGALAAVAAFTMMYIGYKNYEKYSKEIIETTLAIKKYIKEEMEDIALKNDKVIKFPLKVIGDPQICVVAFTFKSSNENIYYLSEILSKEFGYNLSPLQNPPALHYALTRVSATRENIDRFKKSLYQALEIYYKKINDPNFSLKTDSGDTAALYGIAGSTFTRGIADKAIETFLDCLYE